MLPFAMLPVPEVQITLDEGQQVRAEGEVDPVVFIAEAEFRRMRAKRQGRSQGDSEAAGA